MPTEGPVVRILEPSDWKLLRSIRVRALQTNPGELYSRFSSERNVSPSRWRERFESSTWVIASPAGDISPVGIACLLYFDEEGTWYISSVWVDPRYRRGGFMRAMVDVLMTSAEREGAREVFLWVFEENHRAIDAYRKLDFVETGERERIRSGRLWRYEIRMKRAIALASPSG
jgi:RimJ/RimL family protein N-acetyltransferase